jgi:hypothetical protein
VSQNDGSINHSIKIGGITVNITALGIDIAKNVFQLHGIDANGQVILNKKLSRDRCYSLLPNYLFAR